MVLYLFVCFDSLRPSHWGPSQQFFGNVGTGPPGLGHGTKQWLKCLAQGTEGTARLSREYL